MSMSGPGGTPIRTAPESATADANGNASVSFTVPTGSHWVLTRIAVSSNGAYPPKASVTVNGTFELGTNAGGGDSATGNPLPLGPGDILTITWSGASVGSTCTATLTYTGYPL